MNNSSSSNGRSFMHRENHYLLHQQQNPRELDKPELGLHYPHLQNPQYSLFQSQTLVQTQKPMVYDYSYASSLPSDTPIMAKQLMTNPRECESGSEGLRYQVSESGIEVGSCEPNQEMGGGRGEGINEWGVLDRLVTSHLGHEESNKGVRFEEANPHSVHQINQLSLRGEMDFWAYGPKQWLLSLTLSSIKQIKSLDPSNHSKMDQKDTVFIYIFIFISIVSHVSRLH